MTAAIYNRLHNSSLGGSVVHHTQLARSLERILEEAQVSGELILTNRKLKDFPKTGTKHNLADTIIADLSRNRFCELPEEVTTFPFLETLLVYHNTIRSIPESVKQLTSLTYLDLRSNQLSTLPREICFLPLQVLLVSNNRLTTLPDELGRMDRLTDLDASYNQLSALPARIGELRSLRSLSLRSNQLMYLPRELTCLNLVALDVSNNRIASLPLEIRQMSTLVEFDLENNPLTSPPASLCVRGLVHVFKYLEIQATKDEKGSRAGGNYDGYTTLRRAPRHNSSNNILESTRSAARHHIESGYNTCDGFDKRRSHDVPTGVKAKLDSPARRTPTTPPSFSTELLNSSSLTSSTSTIVDDSSLSKSVHESPRKIVKPDSPQKQQSLSTLHQHINYAQSSSSSGSSPDQDDDMHDPHHQAHAVGNSLSKTDEKTNKNLGNIQTYREYKEALKQQRNLEISSVYKIKGQKTLYDMTDASNALNAGNPVGADEIEVRFNGGGSNGGTPMPKSIMKNGVVNGNSNGSPLNGGATVAGDDNVTIPKKPVQKVIPSRNMELAATKNELNKSAGLTNGDCLGTVTWNHDISPEKLSFTMRREFDRQREETELMTQLRSIIETRLKMTLPEDIASALTDGVILCHLANYVRPRSVASIHVPSPGVSKLTMARCRRNVDNFLEACRKIGVDEELICSCADVVPNRDDEDRQKLSINNNDDMQPLQQLQHDNSESRLSLPNAPAVLKTVAALIAMDSNPHHQSIRNLQQQRDFELNLQRQQQREAEALQNHDRYYYQDEYELNENHHQQQQQHHQQQIYISNIDNNCQLDQEQQQQQSTATITKEQMQQQPHYNSNNIDNTIQYRNSLNIQNENENYQYINCVYQNGENYGDDDDQYNLVRATNGAVYDHNDDHDNDDSVHIQYKDENELEDEDHASVAICNDIKICYKQPKQHQQSNGGNMVRNLLRHAKLKSFQKIKLNLMPPSASSSLTLNGPNQGSTSLASTLQTIVETECDVASSGAAGVGVYHVINEKSFENQDDGSTTANADAPVNKYKLLELPKNESDDLQQRHSDAGATVLKRIEFFEHSKANASVTTPSVHKTQKNCNNNNHQTLAKPPAAVSAANKVKSSIFSIYHVPNVDIDGKLSKDALDFKSDCKDSSPLFVHDSHVLTIILSCVFIGTFLLLIFFPLPG